MTIRSFSEYINESLMQAGIYDGREGLYWCSKEQLEKFAELIVKECVQTLIDNTPERYTNESAEEDWDKGYDRAMKDCVHHIQEHFGVEE